MTTPVETPKLSHKKWKALRKKEKRKLERQLVAKQQEAQLKQDDQTVETLSSDSEEEKERQRQHRLWLQREAQAQREFNWKLKKEENERIRREEEEKRIKEEWEERQKEEKEKAEKEAKRKAEQDKLLKEATANEKKGDDGGAWHNPIAPVQYGQERKVEQCPFFLKTGACRFGDRCSRGHDHPECSSTLLFPGMYSHFSLEQSLRDEYDSDINLEYEDTDMLKHFEDFFNDVIPEFKKIGKLDQVKVCRNYEPHLRGNVYIQFRNVEDATEAFIKFNARWYGGRQLNCQYTHVDNWKAAICGLYFSRRCPKGKGCNFLHVFRNPGNEFDYIGNYNRRDNREIYRGDYSYDRRNVRSRDRTIDRSVRKTYSESRERSVRRSRSRSNERSRNKSRSKSRERSVRKKYPESKERSVRRSRSRSKERSHNNRSRSKSRERSRARSKTRGKSRRSRSKSRERSRKRSRSYSRERSRRKSCSKSNDRSQDSVLKSKNKYGSESESSSNEFETRRKKRSKSSRSKKHKHKKRKHGDKNCDSVKTQIHNAECNLDIASEENHQLPGST